MRTRVSVVLLTATLFAVTGCSREAGPTPKNSPDPGPGALAVKIRALQADDCYLAPTEVRSPSCEKYVTQLSNVPGTARKYATGHPGLREAADTLDATVRAYRGNNCADGGDADVCAATLTDMATALTGLHTELSALPDVATRPR
ncbi:hypothetical protein SAXI111661_18980 [Saccharomonospora xinjiangensis]|uniref:Uncharacterized protein n=1 Tax=Saccharomonospora xinjiangensis XJ-54 TaxID=882086 RepID=I0V0G2_9PSEU|nr:hypothetical protein [Saccharomonospora xinjiangensis]EID53615.1 hypothetical protein SacxiDRAFT_1364 [Saccharomonospora xinjiangensis XJ-54]QBQ59086.1 hypothetical protein EYD13_03530 [Saccharomonospora xinjiangensis]